MTPILSYSGLFSFNHDGKPHPVEGAVMLGVALLAIFSFDKWVIRREQHRPHPVAHKSFGKKFQYTILQLIDFFVGFYFCRVRVRDEPFRKATEMEKRVGACFMVFFPAGMALLSACQKSFDAFVDSMTTGQHWIGWLYISFIAVIGGGLIFAFAVAPRIPLTVSVPAAVLSWLTLGWVIWTHHII